jgi:DNA-binding HxlR family transcriptional regulator
MADRPPVDPCASQPSGRPPVGGPFSQSFHEAAELVGRRWTGAILYALAHGIHRFSELKRTVPGLSARMLTERLRELESAGLITREPGTGRARSHYVLTAKGDDLRPVLMALNRWAQRWSDGDDAGR